MLVIDEAVLGIFVSSGSSVLKACVESEEGYEDQGLR